GSNQSCTQRGGVRRSGDQRAASQGLDRAGKVAARPGERTGGGLSELNRTPRGRPFAGLSFSRYRFVTNSRSAGLTMASMALPEPSMSGPPITIGRKSQRLAWALWIAVTVMGAVVGALAAWQVRELAVAGPASLADAFRYVATVLDAVVAAGAQWYVLRRYRLEVYWWVPATVTARFIATIGLVAAAGALLSAASQAPVFLRLVR